MKPIGTFGKWIFVLAAAVVSARSAAAEDPCARPKSRALVMSGGGAKGAFEAGAVYHLVVQRHCDFYEFSGVSVGALNGIFLAQAGQSDDSKRSLDNLARQAQALVEFWQSIKTSDIRRARPLATLRFGLFGLESMNDMEPLHKLLERNISPDKLAAGRPARLGVLSFSTGQYREVLAQALLEKDGPGIFFDYLFATSVIPVYGKLPRIPDPSPNNGPKTWLQFSDASLRHITPVASYFVICNPRGIFAEPGTCRPQWPFSAPIHESIEQLFVIVTSPYSSESDQLTISNSKCCQTSMQQITDGRKILARTLALMDDTAYRSDLDYMLFANEVLRWQWQSYSDLGNKAPTAQSTDSHFVIASFNRDPGQPNAPSRPYDLGLIMPKKELADAAHLLVISPQTTQEQLYCGCISADDTMQKTFELPSLADQCAKRFPRLLSSKKINQRAVKLNLGGWASSECAKIYASSEVAQTEP
jgi:hypothetical protein